MIYDKNLLSIILKYKTIPIHKIYSLDKLEKRKIIIKNAFSYIRAKVFDFGSIFCIAFTKFYIAKF